ncbi:MAG TPA: DUF1223 domain-containing protein [Puia sp.]|nr:DUF1223 domain-containing protein [Puia sp.]
MKALTKGLSFGALALAVAGALAFICYDRAAFPQVAVGAPGFAVVELFTSEGCSSCPPADQLVARLQEEDRKEPVYILAFHVDYWDRLGWKDVFSSPRYTQRQNQYARWLSLNSIYTPQVVVNGHQEMVGSQESAVRKAIDDGLDQTPAEDLTFVAVREEQGKVGWHYQVSHPERDQVLVVALIQKKATTNVRGGENNGRTLSHVQIVRGLASQSMGRGGAGSGDLTLPAGVRADEEELIAFVQDGVTGKILAAARAAIP